MWRTTWMLLLASCGSAGDDMDSGLSGGPTLTLSGAADAGTGTTGTTSEVGTSTGSSSGAVDDATGTTGTTSTTGDLPALLDCEHRATNFGTLELMVEQGSKERLEFVVPGLPEPSRVVAARLKFVGWDVDHPGEEGEIFVNDAPGVDLPADVGWENAEHASEVVVTGSTVAGDNGVAFGAGSSADGSFYRIGQVALVVTAHVEACPEVPAMPAEAVQVDYTEAVYEQRGNWVLRCGFVPPYAYTADGDHGSEDCDGLYMPDGSSKGKATFIFKDLGMAMYKVSIQSRHSANRNPKGALFIVDGEPRRVDQTSGSDVVVDVWGTKQLAGTISVVLDSSLDAESDSVAWVRLDPV